MPVYVNAAPAKQAELAKLFWWLPRVYFGEPPPQVRVCSVSVFDHWLTREEAETLLDKVSPMEQAHRDERHRRFCNNLVADVELLQFRIYGRRQDKVRFRAFSNDADLKRHLEERWRGEFNFRVVVPSWTAAYLSGYDDTSHFFSENEEVFGHVRRIAEQSGLHVI